MRLSVVNPAPQVKTSFASAKEDSKAGEIAAASEFSDKIETPARPIIAPPNDIKIQPAPKSAMA